MSYLGAVTHNGVRVSEGFIPAECLQLVPDVGFQWLCGEPIHPDVLELLEGSKVAQPVVDIVRPTRDVVAPSGEVLQKGTLDPETGVQTGGEVIQEPESHAAIRSAGFGIMGTVAAFLVGLAFTGR